MENLKSNLVLIETVPEAQTASPTQSEAAGDNPGTAEVTSAEKALLGTTAQKIDGLAEQEEGRKVLKESLVNRLNYTHFQDEVIIVQFGHRQFDRTVSMLALPKPCYGDVLECHWVDATDVHSHMSAPTGSISFWYLAGRNSSKSVPEIIEIDGTGRASGIAGDQP